MSCDIIYGTPGLSSLRNETYWTIYKIFFKKDSERHHQSVSTVSIVWICFIFLCSILISLYIINPINYSANVEYWSNLCWLEFYFLNSGYLGCCSTTASAPLCSQNNLEIDLFRPTCLHSLLKMYYQTRNSKRSRSGWRVLHPQAE